MLASALLFFIFGLVFLFAAFVLAMISADARGLYKGVAGFFNALVPVPAFILAFVFFGCAIYCLFA